MRRALAVDLEKMEPVGIEARDRNHGLLRGVLGAWRYLVRRISRVIVGVAASAALLGGIGGAALAVAPTLTAAVATSHGTNGPVPICNPTAIEYGVPVCPSA
jgi:hypothetical protein